MGRSPHLAENRLFDCYLAQQAGETLDPRTAEHLADCGQCAAAFAELVTFMNGVRSEAETEADLVFTPERLRAQQQQIARRIEHVGRSARVISFPGRFGEPAIASAPWRAAPRWIAAAAAAGLFIGVAVGASYQWEVRAHAPKRFAVARPIAPHVTPVSTVGTGPAPSAADEDAFLSDLEAALARPRTPELQPFDALTPHVRDINAPLRPVR
jgi:hypothetical protein